LKKLLCFFGFVVILLMVAMVQGGSVDSHQFGSSILRSVRPESVVRPIPARQWNSEARLWLARSCAGEAGFGALEECSAIAWVYASRSGSSGVSFVTMVKDYSAAVKKDNRSGREWILGLQLDGRKPKGWSKNLNWKKHKLLWGRMLAMLDVWSEGKIANPVESANHFGGAMDTPGRRWKRIIPKSYAPFRNRFYRSN